MKVWVLKKRAIVYGAIVGILGAALILSTLRLAAQGVAVMGTKKDLPVYSVDRPGKMASLTFDAAWGAEDTPTLIKILNKYHVHATFFVVGQWVDKYPDAVKALSDAGNEVMNHSNTHPHMPKKSESDMQKEVSQCDEKIQKITGKKPTLFRPPYGDYNNKVVQVLRQMDHQTIQWTVDRIDTEIKT